MTKKVLTTYTCNDCFKKNLAASHIQLVPNTKDEHICQYCVNDRLEHSLSIMRLGGRKCQDCKGKGILRQFIGQNTTTDSKCPHCIKGMVPLS
jgi:hypothetical protein